MSTYVVLSPTVSCPPAPPVAVGISLDFDFADLPAAADVSEQAGSWFPECDTDPTLLGCHGTFDQIIVPMPSGAVAPSSPPPPFLASSLSQYLTQYISPFQYLAVDYQTDGHGPTGVYSAPHFDLHFMMVNQSDTSAIALGTQPNDVCPGGLSPTSFAQANAPFPAACFPASYANYNLCGAFIGNHYLDTREPEVAALAAGDPDVSLWAAPSMIFGGFNGREVRV